jgi:cyclase
MALDHPKFIEQASREFGAQCIVVSIDVKLIEGGAHTVMHRGAHVVTERIALDWAYQVEQLGAGEILLNSVDRDGMKNGYDIELLNTVCNRVRIPVIACGGVGEWDHFAEALKGSGVDAVAAANIFHYNDQSVYLAKKYLFEHGLNCRPPQLLEI